MKNYLLIACLAMLLSSCSTEEDFNQDNQDLVTETKDDAFAYKKEWDGDLDFIGDFKAVFDDFIVDRIN